MDFKQMCLTSIEKNWILTRRVKRLSDNQETLIYPMGAERYLAKRLTEPSSGTSSPFSLQSLVQNKRVLIIPGYANNGFIFAKAGAKSVTVYDQDPVTIAWLKAFQAYYHYSDPFNKDSLTVGTLLDALTDWYPRLLTLPKHNWRAYVKFLFHPNALRRQYLFYMLSLVQKAVTRDSSTDHAVYPNNLSFHTGKINDIFSRKEYFDVVYVPYLLGITHGVTVLSEITDFCTQLMRLAPKGHVIITPTQSQKEFRYYGKQYLSISPYQKLKDLPKLNKQLVYDEPTWFNTQGLSVFTLNPSEAKRYI